MNARKVAVAMAVVFIGAALALERLQPFASPLLAGLLRCELIHLLVHTILYGSLAFVLAQWWFSPAVLEGPRGARLWHALGAAGCFALIAIAQELAQGLGRGRLSTLEALFDLAVDLVAATLALIAWAGLDARRTRPVASALGVVLHPGLVGPLGVLALTLTSLEQGTPEVVRALALAAFVATALLSLATLAGLKVSGHAAVPMGLVVLIQATSLRGVWPCAFAAMAVGWARVREGRHTVAEVSAGWGIAGLSGWIGLLGG